MNNFDEGFTNCDIAKAIVDHFAAENMKVLSIQQRANKIARVTFDSKLVSEIVQLRGELDIGGVKVGVVPPPPPPPNWTNVVVYNLPFDAPNRYISDALKFFGTVQNVRYQYWTNLPEVATGTRVVRINLTRSIPRFVKIGNYRCKVWYRGQPVYCDICKADTHLASSCPFKGKCLSCEGVGHLARHCPTICFKCKGGHASDSCPNRRRWERPPADEDDFRSVVSDLDAGEVIAVDPVEPSANSAEAADPAAGVADAGAADAGATVACATDVSAAGGTVPDRFGPIDFLAPRPSRTSMVDDERFNQLDEIQTQEESLSQSVLDGLSGVVNNACESAFDAPSPASVPVSDSSSGEGSFVRPQDVSMSGPSAARKREASELLSSDDSRSRPRLRKAPRPHLPSGVSAAASLARPRSSSGSRSRSGARSTSKS